MKIKTEIKSLLVSMFIILIPILFSVSHLKEWNVIYQWIFRILLSFEIIKVNSRVRERFIHKEGDANV